MKKAIVAVCAFLLTVAADATVPFHKRLLQLNTECFDGKYLPEFIVRFEEQPLLVFRTHRMDKDKKDSLNETVLLVSPQTKSWSLIEVFDEENYCVVGYGIDAMPASDALMQQKPKKYY